MDEVYGQLLDLLRRILNCDRIDPRADLVDHGANSLTILQIVDVIGERYGVDLSLTDALDAPDVDSFAALVVERARSRAE